MFKCSGKKLEDVLHYFFFPVLQVQSLCFCKRSPLPTCPGWFGGAKTCIKVWLLRKLHSRCEDRLAKKLLLRQVRQRELWITIPSFQVWKPGGLWCYLIEKNKEVGKDWILKKIIWQVQFGCQNKDRDTMSAQGLDTQWFKRTNNTIIYWSFFSKNHVKLLLKYLYV